MPVWARTPGRLHQLRKTLRSKNTDHADTYRVDGAARPARRRRQHRAGAAVAAAGRRKDPRSFARVGGQEALDTLKSLSPLPDIVLVDHQMPGVSGTDVGRYVKSLPEPRPRVIAMSASPLPEDELAIFDDFLHKPVDQDLLRAAIAGSSARPSAARAPSCRRLSTPPPSPSCRPSCRPAPFASFTPSTLPTPGSASASWNATPPTGTKTHLRRCAHALKGAAAMAGVSRHRFHRGRTRGGTTSPPGPRETLSSIAQCLR